jgi:hypothetical protein|tara:strand:- start:477 stop:1301 length:825 start_codon:yes stop_codon:yes gene_type:complete
MSTSISTAFIKQFEAEVHMAYQRMGSKLANTVRQTKNVKGSQARFQKVGKGAAVTKNRHSEVPTMDIAHTTVDVTLADFYASDYVDTLDEMKTNVDERQVLAQSSAAALGRKTDQLILDVLDAGTNSNNIVHGSAALTLAKTLAIYEAFGDADIPDDGQRYFVVSPAGWADLLAIDQFSNADYVGDAQLPFAGGMTAKRWLGFMWFTHSGLTKASTTRNTHAYHKSAIGLATGADIKTEVNYIPEKVAHLTTSYMSMQAVAIDPLGFMQVEITE